MRPHKKRYWLAFFVLLGVLPMTGCFETKIGDMTIEQVFPDQRVLALVKATVRGNYAEADRQIQAGADVNYVGTEGISPLLWVLYEGTLKNDYRGLEYLLKAGADPNYREAGEGLSAMYLAAGGNSVKLLELLLKHGGNPNLLGAFDKPLLHVAVFENRKENIKLLLDYGADVNILRDRRTAADSAVALGRYDLVLLFLERGLTYDLQGLARGVQMRLVGTKEGKLQRDKVIEMLKERGVEYQDDNQDN